MSKIEKPLMKVGLLLLQFLLTRATFLGNQMKNSIYDSHRYQVRYDLSALCLFLSNGKEIKEI